MQIHTLILTMTNNKMGMEFETPAVSLQLSRTQIISKNKELKRQNMK